MPYCKSGRHFWVSAKDAHKCCNGYKRVISIPADVSCDTVNADNVGYTWVKEGNAVERKSETVVNMQRFIKNIETSKVKGYFWAGGLGFPWHPVEAPTQEQAVEEFSKGSKVSPSKILCRTVPPKKGRVSDSGGMSYKAPLYRIFDGKRYVRFSGASSKAKADFWAYSLRGAGRSVRITTTRKPKTYYHVYVKVPETKSKKKRRN